MCRDSRQLQANATGVCRWLCGRLAVQALIDVGSGCDSAAHRQARVAVCSASVADDRASRNAAAWKARTAQFMSILPNDADFTD
jgi:hypothetical protein